VGQAHPRKFLIAAGALLAIPLAYTQHRSKTDRIGFLRAGSASGFASQIAGLKEVGYVEGKSIALEFRWPRANLTAARLANELVAFPVDVLITQGIPAMRAAKAATTIVPIVMAAVSDAVVMGLVPTFLVRAETSANLHSSMVTKRADHRPETAATARISRPDAN
jgi:putative tryptophan/tyrosine transport system substrate-binding protein